MSSSPFRSSSIRNAFTLIELPVVIAIIAILAAILFPVFARARENARRASCMSNLKQVGLGVLQYTQDYDEKYPQFHNNGPGTTPLNARQNWAQMIYPYVKSTQVFMCPSNAANTAVMDEGGTGTLQINRSYGVNPRILAPYNKTVSLSLLNSVSQKIMIAESGGTYPGLGRLDQCLRLVRLINLAVGGQWYSQEMDAAKTPYKPWQVDETTMPWKMQCDYVRVYRSKDAAAQIKAAELQDRAENNHLTREVWTDVPGTAVAQIPLDKKPNSTTYVRDFVLPANVASNYGTRVRGYITAPTTGDYTFWVAGDDNCELRISPDDKPASALKIASVSEATVYTGQYEWNKAAEQKSAPVHMEAGKRYFIEALQKQGDGGDSLTVAWLKPAETADKPSEVIPASVLSPFIP